jgi:signal transduction histidine kinase
MQRRLLFTYLSLTTLLLLVLETPLALSYSLNQFHHLSTVRTQETQAFAEAAQPVLSGAPAFALRERMRSYDQGNDTLIVLADRTGRIVETSRPDIGTVALAVHDELAAALRGIDSSLSNHRSYSLTPGPVVIVKPVRQSGQIVGAVVTISSTGKLRADIFDHVVILLIVGALALAAVALAGVPLTRWILQPIRRLDQTAHAIADGAYDMRAPCAGGPTEVRGLAEAFNRMADRLVTLLQAQRAFVADTSHQMRNPLTALRLRVEGLEPVVATQAKPQLEQAVAEVERLSVILDQLLRLARAEGRHDPVEPVDVAGVVDGRLEAWQGIADQKGVMLLPRGPHPIVSSCAPGILEQILDVLIDNAIHASPDGASVVIDCRASGGEVQVRVIDEGPGMNAEDRARALDRFWRGATSASRDGSGLGLAIADALVQANGGTLRLDAADPHGLDAVVTLRRTNRTAAAG